MNAWVEIKPKDGYRSEIFDILALMFSSGIASEGKAWGFFGDPLDHHWMVPVYHYEPVFVGERMTRGRGWNEEWADMTSFCAEDRDGDMCALPTF